MCIDRFQRIIGLCCIWASALTVLGAFWLSRPNAGLSGVVISPDSRDVGTILTGAIVEVRFNAKNLAPVPVRLADLQKQCGCTDVQIERREFKSVEIIPCCIRWNTTGIIGQKQTTVLQGWEQVDGRAMSACQFSVSAEILEEAAFEPAQAQLSEDGIRDFTVRLNRHIPAFGPCTIAEVSPPLLQANLLENDSRLDIRLGDETMTVLVPFDGFITVRVTGVFANMEYRLPVRIQP